VHSDEEFATSFRRWTALAALALVAATIRLWLPQTVFPRVPLIAAAVGWPDGVELLAVGGMFGGLLLTFTPQRQRFGWAVFAVALGVAVLADQHRLQPWAWQFGLLAVVFATAGDARQRQLARWLAIGVYLHSGLSKLDFAFLHESGPRLVDGVAAVLGLETQWWSPGFRSGLAATLPLGELVIAIGLAVPRTRRWAAWLAVGMHVVLLAVLGPWGRNQAWGVLLWNVFFVGQTLLLFAPWRAGGTSLLWTHCLKDATSVEKGSTSMARPSSSGTVPAARRSALWLGEVAVILGVVAPFLESFGLFDHWPAWSVYSERSERVTVLVPAGVVDELPASVRPHVGPPDVEGRRHVRIDRWSLDSLGVPV
jgi:hypothetical protein